jgi:predicted GH43/DUF377 family glycosyl hydrolase
MTIIARRIPVHFYPNRKRVIARYFMPGELDRAKTIIQKIMDMSDKDAQITFNQVQRKFSKRHRNITKIFEKNFNNVVYVLKKLNIDPESLSLKNRLLIGSYFTMEYSIESAAFFNPSIIEDPHQSNLEEGQKRIIVSFRATGEGHISSIVFRSGIIDKDGNLTFKPESNLVDAPEVIKRHIYDKKEFIETLDEMDINEDIVGMVLDRLADTFTYGELQAAMEEAMEDDNLTSTDKKVMQTINWIACSHYEITFSLDTAISERVIFPISYIETHGIEDARFVRFTDEDGSVIYYATYTAVNGANILPRILETEDFHHFKTRPLHGEYAKNKGMALFPRKINGKYAMISRIDGVCNYIMLSDDLTIWLDAQKIQDPSYPWEFIQIGNAGSPIETEKGWLLITHGVGPMRSYSLGVTLLDLEDPTKLIAKLKEPLLVPNEEEREGYVPNVVYSCGSIIHNNELIIPYGISDFASTFARIPLDVLFSNLLG